MTGELLILYFEPSAEGGDSYSDPVDITDLVESFQYTTSMDSQPGTLILSVIGDNFEYVLGGCIEVRHGDEGVFKGYIFTVSMSNEAMVIITVFDQSRYLKNQDTFVFEEMTVDALFRQMCSDWGLVMGVVDASGFMCKKSIHEGRSIWDVIGEYCDETLVGTGKYYFVRDVFGKLELRDVEALHTGLVIDDVSLINGYDYEVSIDKDTYNQVKIGKENGEKTERVWVVAKDSTTQKQWGLLQYHRKFNEATPDNMMEGYADKLLKIYNRHTQTLSLVCFGDFRVRAGSGIQIKLSGLKSTSDDQNYIVKSCTHTVNNMQHRMQLELAMDRVI